MLLQEGISAVGIQELSKKISNIINMNTKCVQDFVDYLWEDGLLAFDQISSTYLLASSLHFSINPDLNNAMFADLEVKEADCNDILYIESLSDFYLEEDFQNNEFKRKGGVEDASSQEILQGTKYAISAAVDLKRDKISNLLTRAFLNTNIHSQKKKFSYCTSVVVYVRASAITVCAVRINVCSLSLKRARTGFLSFIFDDKRASHL